MKLKQLFSPTIFIKKFLGLVEDNKVYDNSFESNSDIITNIGHENGINTESEKWIKTIPTSEIMKLKNSTTTITSTTTSTLSTTLTSTSIYQSVRDRVQIFFSQYSGKKDENEKLSMNVDNTLPLSPSINLNSIKFTDQHHIRNTANIPQRERQHEGDRGMKNSHELVREQKKGQGQGRGQGQGQGQGEGTGKGLGRGQMGWQGHEQGQKQEQGQRGGHGQGHGHGGGQRRGRWEGGGHGRGQGGVPHVHSDNQGGMSRERSIPSAAAAATATDTDTTATVTTTSTSASASTYSYYHVPSLFPVVDKVLLIDPDDAQTGLPLPSISISPTEFDITDQDASLNPTISETYTGKIRLRLNTILTQPRLHLMFLRYR